MVPKISVFLLAGNRLLREALAGILRSKADICVAPATPYRPDSMTRIVESGPDILLLDSVAAHSIAPSFVRDVIRDTPGLKVMCVLYWASLEIHSHPVQASEEGVLRALRAGFHQMVRGEQ